MISSILQMMSDNKKINIFVCYMQFETLSRGLTGAVLNSARV